MKSAFNYWGWLEVKKKVCNLRRVLADCSAPCLPSWEHWESARALVKAAATVYSLRDRGQKKNSTLDSQDLRTNFIS